MVELNTLLMIGAAGFGSGVIATVALVLLLVIYNNTVGCNDKKEDEDQPFIIPMSQIPGMNHGGYSPADIQRAAAMVRHAAGQAAGQNKPPEETKEVNVGTYL